MSSSDTTRPSSSDHTTRSVSFRAAWATLLRAPKRRHATWVGRTFFAMGLAGLVGGCSPAVDAGPPVRGGGAGSRAVGGRPAAVDAAQHTPPAGSRLARVSVNVRNELIYDLTGGGGGFSPTHRLDVKLVATQVQVFVDINTGRPDVNNYGIDSTYTLTALATGRVFVQHATVRR